MKKILNLVITKKWFDMIKSGEKTEEYREIKSFWLNRLLLIKNEDGEKYRNFTLGNSMEYFSMPSLSSKE